MSKITTIYDAVVTRLATVFPTASGWERMTRSAVENNTDQILRQGYGFRIDQATNTRREVKPKVWIAREMTITIARQAYANDLDVVSRDNAIKALLEDQKSMLDSIEADPTLQNPNVLAHFTFVSDGGIQNVVGENEKFLKLECLFRFEYFENL